MSQEEETKWQEIYWNLFSLDQIGFSSLLTFCCSVNSYMQLIFQDQPFVQGQCPAMQATAWVGLNLFWLSFDTSKLAPVSWSSKLDADTNNPAQIGKVDWPFFC